MRVVLLTLACLAVCASAAPATDLTDVRKLLQDVKQLQAEASDMEHTIQTEVDAQLSQLMKMQERVEQLKEKRLERDEKVTALQTKCSKSDGLGGSPDGYDANIFGFAAQPSATRTVSSGQIIPYDSPFYVQGGGYNTTNIGTYSCPQTGYYLAYGHFFNVFNEPVSARLFKGTTAIIEMKLSASESDTSFCLSLQCNQNEELLVRVFSGTFRIGPDSSFFAVTQIRDGRPGFPSK